MDLMTPKVVWSGQTNSGGIASAPRAAPPRNLVVFLAESPILDIRRAFVVSSPSVLE